MGILSTLPSVFIGGGEVKNFTFTKVLSSDKAYVFKVETSDGSTHYETIKRLVTPVCVDFEKKIFSETEFKEYYPKSSSFGINGWCFRTLDSAINKFKKLNEGIDI